jgi:hypothetical protein
VSEPCSGYAGGVNRVVMPTWVKASARRSAGFGLAAFVAALLLFLGVGASRLWPRISGQHLPLSLVWPFARPLLAVALELGFLVSVPIALGWSSSTRAARLPAAASWRSSALTTFLLLACLGALSFGASSSLDSGGTSPGELAAELVATARESCVESAPPAEVSVPMVGFSWICEASHSPRLRGHAPIGKQAEFEATAIDLGDDLKRISLAHFKLAFNTPAFPVQVHAEHATLSGLPPWGRSRRMPFGLRSWLFVLSAGLAAYGVGRLAARTPWLPAWAGALLGASVSVCLWLAFSWLERQEPRWLTYCALPGAGVGAVLAEALGLALGLRLWLRFRQSQRRAGDPPKYQ